ncbi:MAG: hypothetical protein ACREU7_13965, partial [Burkholderiales bacterium]
MLVAPVLIIESDDWGFGPLEQAECLREIGAILLRHRDGTGQAAVMTLGVILAGPDTARIAADNCRAYHRLMLTDAPLDGVRAAMAAGARQGVFALQLHGLEHFWPPALIKAATVDPSVRSWLTTAALPETEALPSHLQSRWIDAPTLPSKPFPLEQVAPAAQEEVKAFKATFGTAPEVVVPPTFVWTRAVERAWYDAGVRILITPGRRYERRDAHAQPVRADQVIHNAERAPSGLMYLVRNDYFEPAFGHTAERGLAALAVKTRLGRPTLLETHRVNFVGSNAKAARALGELDRLLSSALASFPNLRFMSSAELARHYRDGSPLLERRYAPQLHCVISRLAETSSLRKL